jgi:hypothetical protein
MSKNESTERSYVEREGERNGEKRMLLPKESHACPAFSWGVMWTREHAVM